MCLSTLGVLVYGGLLVLAGFAAGFVLAGLLQAAQRGEAGLRRERVGPRRRRPWEG